MQCSRFAATDADGRLAAMKVTLTALQTQLVGLSAKLSAVPTAAALVNDNTGCRAGQCAPPSIAADGDDLTFVAGGGSIRVQDSSCGEFDLCEVVRALDATNAALAKLTE